MSSQKIDVSSNQEFSDNVEQTTDKKNDDMLHPNWNSFRRQQKNKAKSTCGLSSKKGSQEQQILFYKEKAHQSFMQVIQVQQLHQEEIQQVRQQYEQKLTTLKNQLKQKNQMIEAFEKNSSRHLIEFKNTLQMEDIGLIQCRETNWTRFDQSTILTFKEFLSQKQGDAKISSMRENIFNFITNQIHKLLPHSEQLIKIIKREVNSIFQYVNQVRQQLLNKVQSHQALLKRYEQIDSSHKKLKSKFQSVQKDAILMSQNLKKIKDQKLMLQKKNNELERRLKQLQKSAHVQGNTKQNMLKISLNQVQNGLFTSRRFVESQKQIVKNGIGTMKTFKTHYDYEKNKSGIHFQERKKEKSFTDVRRLQDLSKNEDSFDVQDLIAEMNVDLKNKDLNIDKNQKRSHLMVSQPLDRIRKKSFDN